MRAGRAPIGADASAAGRAPIGEDALDHLARGAIGDFAAFGTSRFSECALCTAAASSSVKGGGVPEAGFSRVTPSLLVFSRESGLGRVPAFAAFIGALRRMSLGAGLRLGAGMLDLEPPESGGVAGSSTNAGDKR